MAKFTKETIIGEIAMTAPQAAPLFQSIGMHCLGCAMSSGETVEEACLVHGADPDEFLAQLNALVEE
jgi:hybrid cluster-associated redox disulfide protein